MNIQLNDCKSNKLRNLSIMKLSSHHTELGDKVYLNEAPEGVKIDRSYFSVVFDADIPDVLKRAKKQEAQGAEIIIGGGAWDRYAAIDKKNIQYMNLPPEIEACRPDYSLYTTDVIYKRVCGGVGCKESKIEKADSIRKAGIGYSTKGCPNKCEFCDVWRREGDLHQASSIADIVNPESDLMFLLDNDFSADPYNLDKIKEINERGLTVEITQGINVRRMTDELAVALGTMKHRRSLHYAWDITEQENIVVRGIKILSQTIKPYRHRCYMLVGFNSTFEQDTYRFRRLREMGVDPYVMIYRGPERKLDEKQTFELADVRLHHFARWVNGYFFKKCSFVDYIPWWDARLGNQITEVNGHGILEMAKRH